MKSIINIVVVSNGIRLKISNLKICKKCLLYIKYVVNFNIIHVI